jgi:CBS domain-containing protein
MRVQEMLMTKSPAIFSVHPDDSIEEALQALAEKNVGVLLVMDGNKLLGIVSERDIVREAAELGVALFGETVQAIMTTDLIIASPDDELGYLINTMTNQRIRHLPVLDGDELIGIISIGDVVKAMQAKYEGELHHLRHYVADQTGG